MFAIQNGTKHRSSYIISRDLFRGPGYPYHVLITGNRTVLGIANRNEYSPSLNLQVGGDLTVNSSCTLDATNYLANLTVHGNLVNSGMGFHAVKS